MLQAIRDRAHGIFSWVLLIIIGVPFALWGIQNYLDAGQERPVAEIGKRKIYERDVNRAYEESLQTMPGLAQFDEKEVKRQSLERLIREELISTAAHDQGLYVGDDGVRDFLQALPYFQTDGAFDKDKYRQMLASQNLAPAQYAEQVRGALAMEQYQRGITDSVLVLEEQVQTLYRLRNQQRAIDYVVLPPRKSEQALTDNDISNYYDQHRAEFRDPETVSIDYLVLTLDELARAVDPSEADLRALYEEQKNVFTTEERRRVSHILVAAEEGNAEADQKALAKIKTIQERLRKGDAFAKLAQELSEDSASASKGGDLGVLAKGTIDPALEAAATALGKEQVSEPVRTPFGYHLIQVTGLEPGTTKSFEQVRAELVKMFQRNAADSRFYELGQKLTELSFEHPDTLEPAAKAVGKTVQNSAPFTRAAGEGIAAQAAVRDAAFSDDVLNGKNSDLIELSPEEVAVIRVRDHRPAADRSLEAVRAEVVDRMRRERSLELTRQSAMDVVKALDGGASLADQARSAHVTVQSPAAFRRDTDAVPMPLVSAVFSAAKPSEGGRVSGVVALGDGSQAVYQLKSIIDPKPAPGDQEIERLKGYLVANLGQRQFAAWLDSLRRGADVEIMRQEQQ